MTIHGGSPSPRSQYFASRAPVYGLSLTSTLAYSADGRWLAALTQDGAVSVWSAATATTIDTSQLQHAIRNAALDIPAFGNFGDCSMAWTPGRDLLMVYGHALKRVVGLLPASGQSGTVVDEPHGTDAVVRSVDGERLFVTGNAAQIIESDRTDPAVVPLQTSASLDGHLACWSADGKQLVTWDPVEASGDP
jgi:WD40 repeat protein